MSTTLAGSTLSAVLKGLDLASHQHGADRAQTLTTICAMLLGSCPDGDSSPLGSPNDSSAPLPLFTCLKGNAAAEIISQSYTFNRLCSSEAFSLIFALTAFSATPAVLRANPNSRSVLRQGMTRLFWRDVDRCERTFRPVFDGLVSLAEAPGEVDPRPNVELACAFFLHYCKPSDFKTFLERMKRPAVTPAPVPSPAAAPTLARAPSSVADNFPQRTPPPAPAASDAATLLQAEDSSGSVALPPLSPQSRFEVQTHPALPVFIKEVCGMLNGMRNASSLLRYLEMLAALGLKRRIADEDDDDEVEEEDGESGEGRTAAAHQITLDSHSAARLLTTLDALSTPGGPLYPTPELRRQAVATTRAIFPDGHRQRRLVACAFRALHPVALTKATTKSWVGGVLALLGCSRSASSGGAATRKNAAAASPKPSATTIAAAAVTGESAASAAPRIGVPPLKLSPPALLTPPEPSSSKTASPRKGQLLGHTGRSGSSSRAGGNSGGGSGSGGQ